MKDKTVGQLALAGIIREARAAQSLSLRDLADRVGVDFSTISKIESGDQVPSVALTGRLATALGIDPYRCLYARWMHFADRFACECVRVGFALDWRADGGVYLVTDAAWDAGGG